MHCANCRCKHEHTYWEEIVHYGDPRMYEQRKWARRCTKCKAHEYRFAKREPKN